MNNIITLPLESYQAIDHDNTAYKLTAIAYNTEDDLMSFTVTEI